MSLHGDIRVNGKLVGRWSAQRAMNDVGPDGQNLYKCDFILNQPDGPPSKGDFIVVHRYQDGALRLAARVLGSAAMEEAISEQGRRRRR